MSVNDEDAPATQRDLAGVKAEVERVDKRLSEVHRSLALEIVKTHERIDRVETNLREEIRQGSSRILKSVEDFMTQVGKTDRAQIIADWRLSELEKRVETIESRPS